MTAPSAPSWPQRPARPKRRSVPGEPDIDQKRKSEGGPPERRVTGRDEDNGEYPTGEPFRPDKPSSAKDVPPPAGSKFEPPKQRASEVLCRNNGNGPPRPCSMSRSVRNNNPGAIEGGPNYKSHGITGVVGGETHPDQAQATTTFINGKYGFAAQTKLLNTYRSKNGLKTFRGIGNRYSGDSYGQAMADHMGMGIDEEITDEQWNDPEFRYKLQRFMAMYEAGGRDGQEAQGIGTFEDIYDPQDLVDGLEMGGISFKKKADAGVGAEVKPQSQGLRLT
jgi:hypothetical protein